jgi:malonyl-CoA/methylmalonyl-CoA synthetase
VVRDVDGVWVDGQAMLDRTADAAGQLHRAGYRPGDRIVVEGETSADFVIQYCAALRLGLVVMPVNPAYTQRERDIVTAIGEPGPSRRDAPFELDRARPFDPAMLSFTSGTTGTPKGVVLSHANLRSSADAVRIAWHWTQDDVLILCLPLFHMHGLGVGIHGTLLAGASMILQRGFDPEAVLSTCAEATMFFGVPTMYTRLIAEAERRGTRPEPIRLYVSGSAPLSVQTFERFERLFGQPILERYGMTETIMNLTNPYRGERRPGTVGMPFPGQEARIVDVQTREPIDDGRPGEIQVRGPHVFKGYWRNPEATAEAFDPDPDPQAGAPARNGGWFNTGDLGWRSADGYYTISGRARELIISGGFNIYPREVEEVLQSHPAVAEAAVLGLPDPDFGEQVAAAVVLRPGAAATAEELVAHCRDQLASYKKPRQLFFVESLPHNALGKVQKHLLKEQLAAHE